MRAVLEFNLPEEAREYADAVDGARLRSALEELDRVLRGTLKHGKISEATRRELEAIRAMIPGDLLYP